MTELQPTIDSVSSDVCHCSASGGEDCGPPRRRALPHTRAWFGVFLAWMGGLAGLTLWLTARWDQFDDPLAMRGVIVALMCFYLSLCNTLVPLPTAWIVLLAASPQYALLPHAGLNVACVALLGALATALANLNEYHLLAYGFGGGLGARLRRTPAYAWAVRWFERAPFGVLTLVAFFPIPVDAVRWLAILHGYPRLRFGLAYFLGRAPRYVIFAACSVFFTFTEWQILAIQVGLVLAGFMARAAWRLRRRPARPRPAA